MRCDRHGRFTRRMIFAYHELERDMLVSRLQHGLERKRKTVEWMAKQVHLEQAHVDPEDHEDLEDHLPTVEGTMHV
jgi:DNA invertase Pin-like site-specific DNA recombinase